MIDEARNTTDHFPVRVINLPSYMKHAIFLRVSWKKGEASGEFSKMNAIMGEDIEETGDFIVNEKEKNINLTEDGVKKVEKVLSY